MCRHFRDVKSLEKVVFPIWVELQNVGNILATGHTKLSWVIFIRKGSFMNACRVPSRPNSYWRFGARVVHLTIALRKKIPRFVLNLLQLKHYSKNYKFRRFSSSKKIFHVYLSYTSIQTTTYTNKISRKRRPKLLKTSVVIRLTL